MPEHFTKNTIEASFWCSKCGKATMHRVDDGRRGPCLFCMNQPLPLPEEPQAEQLLIEEVYGTITIK